MQSRLNAIFFFNSFTNAIYFQVPFAKLCHRVFSLWLFPCASVHKKLLHHNWAEERAETQRPDFALSGFSPLLLHTHKKKKGRFTLFAVWTAWHFLCLSEILNGEIESGFSSTPVTSSADAQGICVCTQQPLVRGPLPVLVILHGRCSSC